MKKYILPWTSPFLLLHGGAGAAESDPARAQRAAEFLAELSSSLRQRLGDGASALTVASSAVRALEECALFNAGYGSTRQCDGSVRVTASCMESAAQRFSGVALVSHVATPSRLALALQERRDRVLGPLGAQLLARELGLPMELPFSEDSAKLWIESQQQRVEPYAGTVGVVVMDSSGALAAMTSTGGTGPTNFPERMSDVATVAGNYCTPHAAVSCSGVGEQIVDLAVAARMETRLRDGMALDSAVDRILTEATAAGGQFGAILVCPAGAAVFHTTPRFAVAGGDTRGGQLLLPESNS